MKAITITISEYQSLLADSRWLEALESAGVDNWPGCYEARRILQKMESELE